MIFRPRDLAHKLQKSLLWLILLVMLSLVLTSLLNPVNCRDISVPEDYSSIQSAIDASTSGDTIILNKTDFSEKIIIDKFLRLLGTENRGRRPVIRSNGTGGSIMMLNSDGIIIEGLEISNMDGLEITCINITSNNNIIKNACINSSHYRGSGIRINNNSQNNTIYNCSISKSRYGIYLENCRSNRIYDNSISDNWFGFVLNSDLINNNISNNLFKFNEFAIIYEKDFSLLYNHLEDNNFVENANDMIKSDRLKVQ
jgi:parallel beta-helix repeat protein